MSLIIIILRLTAMGSQELQYISDCRGSENSTFSPFFPLLKTLLGNEVSIWRHMSISEGKKRCRGEGRDLKMKAEGEASHYN